jgi:hypothetical protein
MHDKVYLIAAISVIYASNECFVLLYVLCKVTK